MNKYKRYFIELGLILIVTFSMIAYYKHDQTEFSLDLKSGVKPSIESTKFVNGESLTIDYPSDSINSYSSYGKASNIRVVTLDKKIRIECARGYALLGEFPKENDYTKYKCREMSCNIETAEVTSYFDYRKPSSIYYSDISYLNNIVSISNSLIKTKTVKRFGNIQYEKDRSITKVACVPKDQLSHWREYHWYSFW